MKLQETLEHLNFSRLEAQIYMALIGSEPMSAYQLAKKIAIARPSIYNALEHMLDKGMVELVPDQALGRRIVGGEWIDLVDMPKRVVRDLAQASNFECWWTTHDSGSEEQRERLEGVQNSV